MDEPTGADPLVQTWHQLFAEMHAPKPPQPGDDTTCPRCDGEGDRAGWSCTMCDGGGKVSAIHKGNE